MAVMLTLGIVTIAVAGPGNLQQVFNDAKAAYEAGEYEQAAEGFRQVLKYQPGYVYARKYLVQTEAKIKAGGDPKATLESKLAKLKVPSVAFEDASLEAVMAFLSQKSDELSGGKVVANFIYKGSSEEKKSTTLSLKLSNVPMTDVIRYVGQLTNTKFKYEEFAVVGIPTAIYAKEEAQAKALLEKQSVPESKPEFDGKPKDPFAK
jgi:hypothetical protein